MLRRTILSAGGDPSRAIMVGDSGTDIRTARAATVPVIAVDFGYSEVPIATLQPDRLISSFADLPAAIEILRPDPRRPELTVIKIAANGQRDRIGENYGRSGLYAAHLLLILGLMANVQTLELVNWS